MITVGAITRNGTLWNYSCRGPEMDVVALSGDVNNFGDIRTTDVMGASGVNAGNYSTTFGGTSAACPQVAGVAALMLSVNPNLTETNVRTIIQQTATDMGPAGFDNDFGFGRLNAEQAILISLAVSGLDNLCGTNTYSIGAAGLSYANNCIAANVT